MSVSDLLAVVYGLAELLKGVASLVAAFALVLIATALSGCAGVDEHLCGADAVYRQGVCQSFGRGRADSWLPPPILKGARG